MIVVIPAVLRVAPGAEGFVSRPMSARSLPRAPRVVLRAAPPAGGRGGGEGRLLAALALDEDALRTPHVDLAERHLLDVVACFGTLDNLKHQTTPFLFPVWGQTPGSRVHGRARALLRELPGGLSGEGTVTKSATAARSGGST